MRIKTLLCAAGIAALAIPAMAQTPPVYSLNVVGYVQQPFVGGAYAMVANQLDKDGTGTNNTILSVFSTNMPAGTILYKWNGGWVPYTYNKGLWGPNSSASINPGEGVLVKCGGAVPMTNTIVGTVLQGTIVNPYISPLAGYNGLSATFPISGQLQSNTNINYVPKAGDIVYKWSGGWVPYTFNKGLWGPSQPTVNVGEGFLLKTSAGQQWTNSFTAQ